MITNKRSHLGEVVENPPSLFRFTNYYNAVDLVKIPREKNIFYFECILESFMIRI